MKIAFLAITRRPIVRFQRNFVQEGKAACRRNLHDKSRIFLNPRWRTAAILKIVKSPYLSQKSSDFGVIWYTISDIKPDYSHVTKKLKFLPRDAMHKRGLCCHAVSVCLSVRPSRSWITSKRINISSKFFHHRVATPFQYFRTKEGADIPTGTPLTGASNAKGYDKMTIFFHKYLAKSQKRLQLDGHMQRNNV